jgi:8-oxo-dGTP diphosphatase
MIHAAGAIVWREITPLDLEILIIHRPKYDDWSLPKGKIEEGENPITAAYREVIEETGVDSVFGQYLGSTAYEVDGEKKKVNYWMAQAISSDKRFVPNDEVDRIDWVSTKIARHFLTNEDDQKLLRQFRDRDRHTSALVLLRHAKARKRSDWKDYDLDRPLALLGFQQAEKMAKHLAPFHIEGIFSSDAMRCYATVEKLAIATNIPIKSSQDLNEETYEANPRKAVEFVKQLLLFPGNQLVCSHNPILPTIVKKIAALPDLGDALDPADAWIIHHRAEQIISVVAYKQPTI